MKPHSAVNESKRKQAGETHGKKGRTAGETGATHHVVGPRRGSRPFEIPRGEDGNRKRRMRCCAARRTVRPTGRRATITGFRVHSVDTTPLMCGLAMGRRPMAFADEFGSVFKLGGPELVLFLKFYFKTCFHPGAALLGRTRTSEGHPDPADPAPCGTT
eukprot:scaffold3599_cov128-Isochrysis_galbana.AAC.3